MKSDRNYWAEEKILIEVKKYQTLKDFIEKSTSCYHYIMRNNLSYLIKDLHRTSKFSISDIISEIEKYEYLKDFRENSSKHYFYVKKNKLYNLTEKLKRLK